MSTLKLIACTPVDGVTLVSSSLPELDYAAFDAATAYMADAMVSRAETRRNYRRSGPGQSSVAPEDDLANWIDEGYIMRYRALDPDMAQPAEASGSLSVAISTGRVTTDVVLEGLVGSTLQITAGGSTVRTVAIPAPVAPFTSAVVRVSGLSIPAGQAVGFVVSGSGAVRAAYFLAGQLIEAGEVLENPQWGYTDRSTVETDDYGVTRIVPRAYNRRLTARMMVAGTELDTVRPLMESLRAVPCYWMIDERLASMCCVGTYAEWTAEPHSQDSATYSLRIDAVAANDTAILPGGFIPTTTSAPVSMVESANYVVQIESSGGTVFRVGQGTHTTISGRVFRNGEEITSTVPAAWFSWRRSSSVARDPPLDDATWNTAYATGYKAIDLSVDDFLARAAFSLDIIKP